MKHIAWHRGLEICRTSLGHLVVVDPSDSWETRARLVQMLADEGWLDGLFFPSIEAACESIDECAALERRTI